MIQKKSNPATRRIIRWTGWCSRSEKYSIILSHMTADVQAIYEDYSGALCLKIFKSSKARPTCDSATINLIPPPELAKKGIVVVEFSSASQHIICSCSSREGIIFVSMYL